MSGKQKLRYHHYAFVFAAVFLVSSLALSLWGIPGWWTALTTSGRMYGMRTNNFSDRGGQEIAFLGADIVRTDAFAWDVIEAKKGVFDFSNTDGVVAWADRHDVQLLGILLYTPSWSSGLPFEPVLKDQTDCGIPPKNQFEKSYDEYRVHPPGDPDDYAHFVFTTVQRYPQVRYWQIWNEPNTTLFWKPAPNAAAYTELLKKAYAAVKQANPKAQVVLGGMSLIDLDYLEQLYAAGAKDSFDLMAVHPYGLGKGPGEYLYDGLVGLKALMDTHGDTDKKVWLTEIGWYTGTGAGSVAQGVQAEYVRQTYDITDSLDFVGTVFWHTLEDCRGAYQESEPEQNFGLFRGDGSPKAGARAYRAVTGGE